MESESESVGRRQQDDADALGNSEADRRRLNDLLGDIGIPGIGMRVDNIVSQANECAEKLRESRMNSEYLSRFERYVIVPAIRWGLLSDDVLANREQMQMEHAQGEIEGLAVAVNKAIEMYDQRHIQVIEGALKSYEAAQLLDAEIMGLTAHVEQLKERYNDGVAGYQQEAPVSAEDTRSRSGEYIELLREIKAKKRELSEREQQKMDVGRELVEFTAAQEYIEKDAEYLVNARETLYTVNNSLFGARANSKLRDLTKTKPTLAVAMANVVDHARHVKDRIDHSESAADDVIGHQDDLLVRVCGGSLQIAKRYGGAREAHAEAYDRNDLMAEVRAESEAQKAGYEDAIRKFPMTVMQD
ncbi:hypothetical protein GF351_00560 [Candidatus Woesearchaeota archaeon]|nr:hypothetical protein [Candidatus Woesearchaeota archaeon]